MLVSLAPGGNCTWSSRNFIVGERRCWGYKFPKKEGVIFSPFETCSWGAEGAALLLLGYCWLLRFGEGVKEEGQVKTFYAGNDLGVVGEGMKWLVSLRLVLLLRHQAKMSPGIKGVFWLCDFIAAKKEEEQRLTPKPWLLLRHMKSVCLL